jgi:aminomethyltransferase
MESHEWRNWAGYLAAAVYEPGHEREYFAIRNAAALIDVSPLFKYSFRGPQALAALNRIVTRDLSRCAVGQVIYTPWCDDDGQVIDDGTLHRLADDEFLLTSAEPCLAWLQDAAYGLEVRIRDRSAELAAVAVQGPLSRQLLKEVVQGADLDGLRYYRLTRGSFRASGGEFPLTISRTGYTGDLGYELWLAPEAAPALWERLLAAGEGYGALPAGIAALDIARIEAGLIMLQVDYISSRLALIEEQKSSPYELGLGWAVALDKPHFIGRRALLAEAQRIPEWVLTGVEVDWQALSALYAAVGLAPQVAGRASRQAAPIYQGRRQVGYATSHTFSPLLKKYIALAILKPQAATAGAELEFEVTVEHVRRRARARPTPLPFFNPPRKRD